MHTYHGNFEVHLTVQPTGAAALQRFRAWCEQHACKCVRIVLDRGAHAEQPMATYHRQHSTLPEVSAEAQARAADLNQADLAVVRLKIEADPNNADVPEHDGDIAAHAETNYFEHHVKLLRDVDADRERLLQVCLRHRAHLSRNAWRQPERGKEERFVTLRCYRVGRTTAAQELARLRDGLGELGEHIVEIESEYCVYDSNLALDAGWLPH